MDVLQRGITNTQRGGWVVVIYRLPLVGRAHQVEAEMKFNHPYYRMRAEKWRALYLSGVTIGEIAQRYHYAPEYVSKQIGRLNA